MVVVYNCFMDGSAQKAGTFSWPGSIASASSQAWMALRYRPICAIKEMIQPLSS